MILITRQIDSKQTILVNFNYILQKKLEKAQFAMLELCREYTFKPKQHTEVARFNQKT